MSIESPEDLNGLSGAGKVVADTACLRPGVATAEVDLVGEQILKRHGARSAPKLIYGFPGVNLIS